MALLTRDEQDLRDDLGGLRGVAAACAEDEGSYVVTVSGQLSANLSGDGMPADEREKAYVRDELWLDLEPTGELFGVTSHPWDLEPRHHTDLLDLDFAPTQAPGPSEILSARVCFLSCGDKPEKDG